MKRWILAVVALAACACSHSPVTPTTITPITPTPQDVTYAINIPDPIVTRTLSASYPNGIHLDPMDAQQQFNYTSAYGGSPNVYFGQTAPPVCTYTAGIVVAPSSVASRETFNGSDWPGIGLTPNVTYAWLGRFVYTPITDPSTYKAGSCGS